MLFIQVTEYQNMVKDVNRSAYTKRILEIVENIKRQKNDIDKVYIMCNVYNSFRYIFLIYFGKLVKFHPIAKIWNFDPLSGVLRRSELVCKKIIQHFNSLNMRWITEA